MNGLKVWSLAYLTDTTLSYFTGTPIRRHHNYDKDAGLDYGGMCSAFLFMFVFRFF